MNAVTIGCPFCAEQSRNHAITQPGLTMAVGLYMAHLVESHWDKLVELREMRLAMGPVNNAWTRL